MKLKYTNTCLAILILMTTCLTACEEVIDIDLNTAEPHLAVDGEIRLNETAEVRLSYTTSYFSVEEPVYEANAVVSITSSDNETETLSYVGDGLYIGRSLTGQVGVNYQLNISIGDKTYKGSSQLLTPTEILELSYERFDGFGSTEEEEYNVKIVLKNNPNEENYYLIKYYLNDSEVEDSYSEWSHEFFANEETIEFKPLHFIFTKDDVVTVRAYSIDEGTYDYYSDLDEIIDPHGGGSSTPFNPASNLGKDILGYFRAWSYDEKSIQVIEEN